MLPIYRKNHFYPNCKQFSWLKIIASKSPSQTSFHITVHMVQWHFLFRNSLLQWRDRTGFTPVSLLICPKSTFQSRRIFRQNLQRLVQNQQMLFNFCDISIRWFFIVCPVFSISKAYCIQKHTILPLYLAYLLFYATIAQRFFTIFQISAFYLTAHFVFIAISDCLLFSTTNKQWL